MPAPRRAATPNIAADDPDDFLFVVDILIYLLLSNYLYKQHYTFTYNILFNLITDQFKSIIKKLMTRFNTIRYIKKTYFKKIVMHLNNFEENIFVLKNRNRKSNMLKTKMKIKHLLDCFNSFVV